MAEIGGKSLLLKLGKAEVASTVVGSTITITSPATDGLAVGDIVIFSSVGANTTITVGKPYIILTVPTASTFTMAATPGGSAIAGDAVASSLNLIAYRKLAGLRSKSFSFSADGVDITNHDSNEWKTMLDGAGIRSCSFSGDGVYNNGTTFFEAQDAFLANTQVSLALVDVITGRVYAGNFKLSAMEVSGDYDSEGAFSLSGDSSGVVSATTMS